MNYFKFIIAGFLSIFLFSCSVYQEHAERIFSPSELNQNASKYNGAIVTVRGYVTLNPSGHNLYESRKLDQQFEHGWHSDKSFDPKKYLKYCLTIANPAIMYVHRDAFNGKTIIVKGKFIDDYLKNRIDLGACPLSTGIIIDEADLKARYPSIFNTKTEHGNIGNKQ